MDKDNLPPMAPIAAAPPSSSQAGSRVVAAYKKVATTMATAATMAAVARNVPGELFSDEVRNAVRWRATASGGGATRIRSAAPS